MQSWGHASRYDRRTTALHPTRSGVFGLIAAAMGIDKHGADEADRLRCFTSLRFTCVALNRLDRWANELPMRRLEDYHTVTGFRRASGKVASDSTVQTYRHYLLEARFGVLIEGPLELLEEIAAALSDPKWGIWFGRKCCLPASPVLVAKPDAPEVIWRKLLRCAGLSEDKRLVDFDHVIETTSDDPAADMIEDQPVGFGAPIGMRHTRRWIRRVPNSDQRLPL